MRVMCSHQWVSKTAHVKLGEPRNLGCLLSVKVALGNEC